MSEREALEWILDRYGGCAETLREAVERELPRMAKRLDAPEADYYELMLLLCEEEAGKREIDNLRIYTDRELLEALE